MFHKRPPVTELRGNLRRHRPDYLIVLFVSMLALLGLVVLYAISPARVALIDASSGSSLDQNHFMIKQLLYLLVGVIAFGMTASIPLEWWRRYREKLMWLALIACGLLGLLGLIGGVGIVQCTNGACRWFALGTLTFQPAELLKFALVIFLAGFLAQRIATKQMNNLHTTFIPVMILLGISLVLIVGLQKDMGTGIALVGIVASMLFLANLQLRYFGLGLLLMAVVTVLFIIIAPHRLDRVTTFLDGASNTATTDTTSYHITQAKIAIGSGGFIGKSLGNSIQAFGYLPEAVNDSIFAILGEMFGFVGLLAIMAVFLGLLLRLLKTVDHVIDPYYKLLVAGVFGWIATQSLLNIGSMIGVFPLTGVTLPFLSFGGTSLMFIMAALGLAFQVSRYTTHTVTEEGEGHETAGSRRGIGRTRRSTTRGYQRA